MKKSAPNVPSNDFNDYDDNPRAHGDNKRYNNKNLGLPKTRQ